VSPSRVRILLADSDAPTRAGLRIALAGERFTIVGEAESGAAALSLAGEQRPDVALVATDLPGGALDAVRTLVQTRRAVRVVVLSPQPDDDELVQAVLNGAVGYLGKDVSPERLPAVLEGVLAGEVALPRHLSRRLLEELRGRDAHRTRVSERASAPLSGREWEVLHLLAADLGTGEIARRLGISDVTVRRHVSSLLAKLNVPDRGSAVRFLRSQD
jgi:DNA-binding NarL/FixJ family response regulator